MWYFELVRVCGYLSRVWGSVLISFTSGSLFGRCIFIRIKCWLVFVGSGRSEGEVGGR